MTDEENKRQRHLAEMMIAQCDGKIVQDFGHNAEPDGRWLDIERPIAGNYLRDMLRIKPEPREWFVCSGCHRMISPGKNVPCECAAQRFKVREVLND